MTTEEAEGLIYHLSLKKIEANSNTPAATTKEMLEIFEKNSPWKLIGWASQREVGFNTTWQKIGLFHIPGDKKSKRWCEIPRSLFLIIAINVQESLASA